VIVNTAWVYAVTGQINWSFNPNGWRGLQVTASGNEIGSSVIGAAASGDMVLNASGLQRIAAGDVIDMQAGQSSGTTLSTSPFDYGGAMLDVHWVGP